MNHPLSNCCEAPPHLDDIATELCSHCLEHCDFSCPHEWEYRDDSFDHEFGTERIPTYEICLLCDETRSCISRAVERAINQADYDHSCSKED